MANYVTTGYVFWYPTQSLAGGQAGVVNDPDRAYFIGATGGTPCTKFWRISGSNGDIGVTIMDQGLTWATGSSAPTSNLDTARAINGPDAYSASLGGQPVQAVLYDPSFTGNLDKEGPTIFPSFFIDTENYDFSVGGGIILLTGSYLGSPEKGIKEVRWYWTAEDDPSDSGAYTPIIYTDPDDQANFLIRTFGATNNSAGGEEKLAGAVASIGGIFLAPKDLGGGSFILDIPSNFKPGGSFPIYKFVT
jgi:hypothetical protein